MGLIQSKHVKKTHASKAPTPNTHPQNDFELVCRASKELEFFLDSYFRSTAAQGLHDKIITAQPPLPVALTKKLNYLCHQRNSLVHDRNVNKLEHRDRFIEAFDSSWAELQQIVNLYYNSNDTA